MATGQYDKLARIAIDEARLFPGGGQLAQEIQFELWQLVVVEVVGLHRHTLYRSLHDDA